jgi:hypothetical protein
MRYGRNCDMDLQNGIDRNKSSSGNVSQHGGHGSHGSHEDGRMLVTERVRVK